MQYRVLHGHYGVIFHGFNAYGIVFSEVFFTSFKLDVTSPTEDVHGLILLGVMVVGGLVTLPQE